MIEKQLRQAEQLLKVKVLKSDNIEPGGVIPLPDGWKGAITEEVERIGSNKSKEVSTSDLINELRLRGQGQADPVEAGRPVEVPTSQAAQELGVSLPTLRSWMKHGHVDIGIYDKKGGKKRADIHVFRHMLDSCLKEITLGSWSILNF